MFQKVRDVIVSPIGSLTSALGLYLILRGPAFERSVYALPREHFYIVSLVSIIAAGISYAIGVSGIRLRNTQVIFVSLGFVSLTVMFSLHGLSTPGFLVEFNRVVTVAVQLAFSLTGIFLLLSTIPGDNRLIASLTRSSRGILFGWTGLLVGAAAAIFFNNGLIGWLPIDSAPLKWVVGLTTFTFVGIASVSYWRAYRLTNFPLQSGLAHVTILVGAAQIIAITGTLWHISWWLYHFILLLAVLITVFSLVRQYSFGETPSLALQGLFSNNLTERLEAGISPKVQALITAAEAHDTYTAGHAQRVAEYAVRLGETLGCPPEELRALAQGSLLHDIGKLSITDTILNKPGKLNDEERVEIQKHPIYGYDICRKLGFMETELEIIRWHHERLNGRGYPDGISPDKLPRLVRIVSVVDVYDALCSTRSYRPAMDPQAAVRHLETYSGFFLDEALVNQWVEILKQDRLL
jgi:putative nucleotidyltransferase with HDIG domain